MLNGLLALLLCQFAGELIVVGTGFPVPGPVMGMLLLLGMLMGRGNTPTPIRQIAETLLRYLALLYVPAGVGIMVHLDLIARDWFALLLALFISTVMAMAVTALILKLFIARVADRSKD